MVPAAESQQILTVGALTAVIKRLLEEGLPHVSVQGEISNCKLQQSGHWYFTLKDTQAQISAVMFRGESSSLDFEPKNGDKVVVEGSLNVYPPGGRYQILVRKMKRQGIGELLLKLEELKREILRRGWFKKEHKKPLPFLPRKIGVVTSPSGAAIQDILNVLTRRGGKFHLILNPVKVQGEGAAEEIARAIRFFNDRFPVDVLIVGRGGGSFEDLWCFNEEIVAESIFHSRIPIICAVGHETDHTIAEYVADVRAPTPSAAAEMVMAEREKVQKSLDQARRQCQQSLQHHLRRGRKELDSYLRLPLFRSPYVLLGPWMQKLDESRQKADRILLTRLEQQKVRIENYRKLLHFRDPRSHLRQIKQKLDSYRKSLDNTMRNKLAMTRHQLSGIQRTLSAIDPHHLLNKGFSILFAEKDGSVINDAATVNIGDHVRIRLAKGSLTATIDKVEL